MAALITFNTKSLIKNLNSASEFYEIMEKTNWLYITKKYKNKKGRPFSTRLPKKIKISPSLNIPCKID